MVKLIRQGVYELEGRIVKESQAFMTSDKKAVAVKNTLAYGIAAAHGASGEAWKLRFDALVSSDDTYPDILRAASSGGMKEFPLPYTLGSTWHPASADVRAFGLSAAKKFGGDYVGASLGDVHAYMREARARSGDIVLSSDSYARYGALGTLSVFGSRKDAVRLLLKKTYEIKPDVVAVYLRGKLRRGVGPYDVVLSAVKAACGKDFLKGKVLEFIGPGVANLTMDYRNGIDELAAEAGCLASVWETDRRTQEWFAAHGREGDFKEMHPVQPAYYDAAVVIDLSRVEPMLELPFGCGIFSVHEFLENAPALVSVVEEEGKRRDPAFALDCLRGGKVYAARGFIAAECGSYENISEAAELLRGKSACGSDFQIFINPSTSPVFGALALCGAVSTLLSAGASFAPPCGKVRGFTVRAGRTCGKCAAIRMDARSVAATAANGGAITSALESGYSVRFKKYTFDGSAYANGVYHGVGHPVPETALDYGSEIAEYPAQIALPESLLIRVAARLTGAVTTAEDLLPASSSEHRYDPERLASFALSGSDGSYVGRAREIRAIEGERRETGKLPEAVLSELGETRPKRGTAFGSAIVSKKTGEGPNAEGAAACQRVLGGVAAVCTAFSAGYREELINCGILPLTCEKPDFAVGDYLYLEGIADAVQRGEERIVARHISKGKERDVVLTLGTLSAEERAVLLAGCLVNRYRRGN